LCHNRERRERGRFFSTETHVRKGGEESISISYLKEKKEKKVNNVLMPLNIGGKN